MTKQGLPALWAGCVAAVLAFAGPSVAATVVNGSFETGVPGNTAGLDNGLLYGDLPTSAPFADRWTALNGWQTARGPGIEAQADGALPTIDAQDGEYYVGLDSTGNSSMFQNVGLHIGRYMLSFWYSPSTADTSSNALLYRLSGLTSGRVDFSTPGVAVGTWTQITVEFLVKTAKPYRLTFTAAGTSDGAGALLDNVEIAPVPVPASGLVLLGALGGLAMLRRRITA